MNPLTERVTAAAVAEPLSELSVHQRAELDELLDGARELEDLPGRWQAAVLEAELHARGETPAHARGHCCH